MKQNNDKLFNILSTLILIFFNPILRSIVAIADTILFIIIIILIMLGKISYGIAFIIIGVFCLLPILLMLLLLGLLRLLSISKKQTELENDK